MLASHGAGSTNAEAPEKPRKSASVEMEEKVSERRQCDKTDGEEWTTNKSTQLSSQHTESSADSDYSFESHASSSVESRSPRELEEGCDVFLELPQWCKRNPISATGHTESQDSPISSVSHLPDDTTGEAEAISTTCNASSALKHITTVGTSMNHATSVIRNS